jgi:hypothetical protein
MTAYDYPLLGLFWTFIWFYFVATWLVIMFHVILDIFRRDDPGVLKAGWLFIVFILPVLGVLAYIIARGQQPAGITAGRDGSPATADL